MHHCSIKRIYICFFLTCLILAQAARADEMEVQALLRAHLQALGGSYHLDQLTGIYLEGQQIQEGASARFILRKKRPNLMRYTLVMEDREWTLGFDGQTAWTGIRSGQELHVDSLEGPAARQVQLESRFMSPLYSAYQEASDRFATATPTVIDEIACYQLTDRQMEFGYIVKYFLRQADAQLHRRELLDANGMVILATIYSDYKPVGHYTLPHRYENYIDGKLVSIQQIDAVLINPGVLSFHFQIPKS